MGNQNPENTEIHQAQPLLAIGEPLENARAVMIMVHGRGASAEDILSLTTALDADEVAFLAPQAHANTWYPYSFLEPIERNQPHLDSALRQLSEILASVNASGIPTERIVLLGFSQGACLVTEFVARNARRYGGVAGLSGGLIGPAGTPRDYPGSLDGTPVFLGCSDVDFHIPVERVHETDEVLRALNADVTLKIYHGMGHTIIQDEIEHVNSILASLPGS